MLSDVEHDAMRRWYSEPRLLKEARRYIETQSLQELEEYLHMTCLFALSRHSELPEYMRNEEGTALFPTNLNPRTDLEKWRDAIEVGWEVMDAEFGLSRDAVNERIASTEQSDWKRFMDSVERRKKERGLT